MQKGSIPFREQNSRLGKNLSSRGAWPMPGLLRAADTDGQNDKTAEESAKSSHSAGVCDNIVV
jgi:hypothetical protein